MNGYYRATINGEDIGLKFGMAAIGMYRDKIAEEPLLLSNGQPNEIGQAWLIYFGYVNNQLIKGEKADKPFPFFSEWVDSAYSDPDKAEVLASILTAFAESSLVKMLIDQNDEGVKKKNKPRKK